MNPTKTTSIQIPPDVVRALQQQRKIDAIKLLREHRGLGLKEAKQAIDKYVRENPQPRSPAASETGIWRFLVIFTGIVVLYFAYKLFS